MDKEPKFKVGDIVEVDGKEGIVAAIYRCEQKYGDAIEVSFRYRVKVGLFRSRTDYEGYVHKKIA